MPASCKQNGSSSDERRNAWPEDVGIIDLEMYFPSEFVDQTELEEFDGASKGKYTIGLGQTRMGVCSDREDIHSLCLTVTKRLLEKSGVSPAQVGFLMVGTETLLDKSKSVKSVLMQLFEDSGNYSIEGLDTTNACFGGTSSLFHAVNWVESSSWDGRFAIVVCGDIAVYASGPARPTGGAGAVAMLIGPNAPLVMDRGLRSTYMRHVYDFYKPNLSSEYPIVDGKLSIVCYMQAADNCYTNFRQRYEKSIVKDPQAKPVSLNDFDALIFHAPYCKLVQKTLLRLMFNEFLRDPTPDYQGKYKGFEKFRSMKLEDTVFDKDFEAAFTQVTRDLYEQKAKPYMLLATEVGNMYTASVYSCLVSYLLLKQKSELAGKRILLYSYGSGLAASMFSLKISSNETPGSPLDKLYQGLRECSTRLYKRIKVTPKEFVETLQLREETHNLAPYSPVGKTEVLFPGTYYLTGIDESHRRQYSRVPLSEEVTSKQVPTIVASKTTNIVANGLMVSK